ncbi:hypothetical protein EW146_g3450 [Bondarzewia mesenterica]|uniref:Uncharacterized protein n=1 Tax=Bondarzewia mesenterica TaxID=1095465 RepID=A0A4S4M3F1_9AGAM|nr:hypothetical protein EW146_g3450 [Bondarzewia mesenterica]
MEYIVEFRVDLWLMFISSWVSLCISFTVFLIESDSVTACSDSDSTSIPPSDEDSIPVSETDSCETLVNSDTPDKNVTLKPSRPWNKRFKTFAQLATNAKNSGKENGVSRRIAVMRPITLAKVRQFTRSFAALPSSARITGFKPKLPPIIESVRRPSFCRFPTRKRPQTQKRGLPSFIRLSNIPLDWCDTTNVALRKNVSFCVGADEDPCAQMVAGGIRRRHALPL